MARSIQMTDLYIVHTATIVILLWVAVWNLVEEAITWVETKHGINRWKINLMILLFVTLIILIDPYLFEKI